jgi:tetratricopeptide (TPR) repeat protein
MLKAGWEMGTDRIITGYGPGTTPRIYPKYRAKLSGGVETALQLHNTPVQIWADLGYCGTAFLILFLGGLTTRFQKAIPFLKDKLSKNSQGTLLAAGLSLLGYSAFSLTDYQLDIPIFAFLLALNSAVILSLTNFKKVRKRKTPQSHIMGVTAFVLVGIILVQIFPSLRARNIFSTAIAGLEQDDFSSFQNHSKKAIAMAPHEPYYLNSTAGAFLLVSGQTQDLEKRHDLTTKAIDYLTKSLQVDPNQEICHFNLGWLYLDRDPTLAEEHFVQAAFLVPDKGGVYLGYGLGLLHQNKNKEAHRALALESINDPRFITSPIWDTPLLKPHRKRTLEAASEIISSWKYKSGVSFQTRKELAYTNALLLWWTGQDYQIEALITNGDRSNKPLFQLLQNPASFHSDAIPSQPWKSLYLAWKEPSKQSQTLLRQSLLSLHGLTLSSERENTYKEILEKYRNSPFSDLIKAPAGNEPPLMKTYQRRRIAYGMLMKNMDGPTPVDAYVVQENGIVNDFFGSIFPPKGSLPNTLFTNELSNLSAPQN